jgi:hypothetical protein
LSKVLGRLADGPDELVRVWADRLHDGDSACSNTALAEK